MSIKLETLPFEFEGKNYILRCNMNVLSDVQDMHDGDLGAALNDKRAAQSIMEFLVCMMNDYADEMGWEERFTVRSLGRKLRQKDVPMDVMKLVIAAITPDKKTAETDNNEKN